MHENEEKEIGKLFLFFPKKCSLLVEKVGEAKSQLSLPLDTGHENI